MKAPNTQSNNTDRLYIDRLVREEEVRRKPLERIRPCRFCPRISWRGGRGKNKRFLGKTRGNLKTKKGGSLKKKKGGIWMRSWPQRMHKCARVQHQITCPIINLAIHIQIIGKSNHQYQNKITIITVHPSIILPTTVKPMGKVKTMGRVRIMAKAKANKKILGWEVKKERAFTVKNTTNMKSKRLWIEHIQLPKMWGGNEGS